jgi:K+-transporting ATPase A subunit
MFAMTFLQFVTAATGVAACIAIIRGLAANKLKTLGSFYVDLTRATVRLFLPLAFLVGLVLLWQGSPMTFAGAAKATTVEGAEQTIARGVAAPMVAIKQLGTNGGGYFGPNSTHPYENSTRLSNFVETWSITIIPMAMTWTLGLGPGAGRGNGPTPVHRSGGLLAVVHGSLRQLRRGDGRRARQGTSGHAAESEDPNNRCQDAARYPA